MKGSKQRWNIPAKKTALLTVHMNFVILMASVKAHKEKDVATRDLL